jgi:methylphosphotriester-DNA--protein-cysteine methyltransferase
VQFESEAAAQTAGYRACKICLPDRFTGRWQAGQTAKTA